MNEDDLRWVNPAKQLADWEAFEANKRKTEAEDDARVDPEWDNGEVLAMILEGCDRPGDHASPDRYVAHELLDMWRHDAELCPLHLYPEYPNAPGGICYRDYDAAIAALTEATMRHTERRPVDHGVAAGLGDEECCGALYHVTADELAQAWDAHPHGRWIFESLVDDGFADVVVVKG